MDTPGSISSGCSFKGIINNNKKQAKKKRESVVTAKRQNFKTLIRKQTTNKILEVKKGKFKNNFKKVVIKLNLGASP